MEIILIVLLLIIGVALLVMRALLLEELEHLYKKVGRLLIEETENKETIYSYKQQLRRLGFELDFEAPYEDYKLGDKDVPLAPLKRIKKEK